MGPRFTACLGVALCSVAAFAQTTSPQSSTTTSTSAPVAYVYIATGSTILAYTTSAGGTLTNVSSTTTPGDLWHLSVTKKFLFGIDGSSNIYSYAIQPNGGLLPVSVLSANDYAPDTCFAFGVLQVDGSGSNLYAETGSCHNGSFLNSFKILPTGQLQYLGKATGNSYAISQLRFADDSHYAAQTGCLIQESNNSTTATAETYEYKRESNGYLTFLGSSHDVPEGSGRKSFCPFNLASDSANHLVFEYLRYLAPGGPGEFGELYGTDHPIAVYSVASDGKLTTTSNYGNMASAVTYPLAISVSPSNAVLAVGGDEGYQFFHFNGGSQPVKWTGTFQADSAVKQLGWDKADHFYALTDTSLIMYHITATSYKQQAGLTNAFTSSSAFIVLSLQ